MKRSWLVVLGSLAMSAGAYAQSTVTLYGKVDLGVRKATGSAAKEIGTGSDGRFGVRGTESLGGGLNAFFNIEHRFFPDTGATDGPAMWKGISQVGLSGGWGRVGFGRQYTSAFSLVQNQVDPFGGDTVAALRDVSMRVGGITRVRVDGSLRYDVTLSGLTLSASVAESDKNVGPDRPVSFAGIYRSGPLFVAAGVEDPAGVRDKHTSLGAGYRFGSTLMTAGYSSGTMNTGVKAKGWMLGVDHKVGSGNVKAAYGVQERGGQTTAQKFGLGYHHALSKRTTIYADLAQDKKAARSRSGYDLGIIHTF